MKVFRLPIAFVIAASAMACYSQTTATKKSSRKPAEQRAATAQNPAKPATGKLPEAALKRAQEAEKQLAANKPIEALTILTKLDQEYPGHAAINLRLAQIYDKQDNLGPALFFYRRYVKFAGDRAREEFTGRAATVEVSPGARESAEEFAKRFKETSLPMNTPIPSEKNEMAAARSDGSLVPLQSAAQLEQIAKTGVLPDSPVTPATNAPTPYLLNIENLQLPESQTGADVKQQPPANAPQPATGTPQSITLSGTGSRVAVQRGGEQPALTNAAPINSTPMPTNTPSLPGTNQKPAGTQKPVYASGNPEPGVDEDALLARSFSQGSAIATPLVEPAVPVPPVASTYTPLPQASNTPLPQAGNTPLTFSTPIAPQRTPRPAVTSGVAYMEPTPQTNVVSPRAENFFTIKKIGGSRATIRMYNDLPDAITTVKIIPQEEGDARTIIMAREESRTMQIPPGNYDFSISVATSNYPPLSLLDATFAYTFEAGTQYLRRLNRENLQQVK